MKITCQACQARYTIADDKIVGKMVKIRCKKCGAILTPSNFKVEVTKLEGQFA